ncbi:hypothetical protein EIN_491310 [Entamoeba invadens IP1]|uniref:Uncharacterized protein n=1 Tax=Entamoeba invadens IP1 TaxID=370355 RepID=A0A0A1U403_ENTIV|nr:hypothetical protein EIN_491310 [Entamoeba invadens IP1]ELP88962.1 hypothetical protein EIN_491310 [Entamoeba invadens IP1]|eukprot:XP_004255733.1 hypothetical protein EIN_491310 [Entamoeba invadens IP1]
MEETKENVSDILRFFEGQVLDNSLKEFKEMMEDSLSLHDVENIIQQGQTQESQSVVDIAKELLDSNLERDDLLREMSVVGQQYVDLKNELNYYKDLLNETPKK